MADRYLVATGVYSNTAIWSATSGGSGGASVPGVSDAIIFDTNSSGFTCTLDQAVSVAGFGLTSGTGVLDTSGTDYSVTISGSFAMASGTFTANASAISVGLHCLITGGTFTAGTSTVSLVGSGNLYNAIAGNAFNNLTQVGAITTTAIGDVYTDGVVTTSDTGTITDDGGGTRDFHINGSLVVDGVTWVSISTFALWFGTGTTIPADDYGNINLRIRLAAIGTVTMGGNVTTTNGVLIASTGNNATSTLDTGGFDFSCALLQLGAPGQISRGGELAVTGVSAIAITATLTVYADNGVQVNGITVAASGTNAFDIAGDWTPDVAATMDMQDSVVTFTGNSATLTGAAHAFHDIVVNKTAGQTLIIASTFTYDGTWTNTSGYITLPAQTLLNDFVLVAGTYYLTGDVILASRNLSRTGTGRITVKTSGASKIRTNGAGTVDLSYIDFTSENDDSLGMTISGSSGSPVAGDQITGYLVQTGGVGGHVSLEDFTVTYCTVFTANERVIGWGAAGDATRTLSLVDGEFQHCVSDGAANNVAIIGGVSAEGVVTLENISIDDTNNVSGGNGFGINLVAVPVGCVIDHLFYNASGTHIRCAVRAEVGAGAVPLSLTIINSVIVVDQAVNVARAAVGSINTGAQAMALSVSQCAVQNIGTGHGILARESGAGAVTLSVINSVIEDCDTAGAFGVNSFGTPTIIHTYNVYYNNDTDCFEALDPSESTGVDPQLGNLPSGAVIASGFAIPDGHAVGNLALAKTGSDTFDNLGIDETRYSATGYQYQGTDKVTPGVNYDLTQFAAGAMPMAMDTYRRRRT